MLLWNNVSLTDIINTSINMDDDKYNMNGVNVSAAARQELISWKTVDYSNKRKNKKY